MIAPTLAQLLQAAAQLQPYVYDYHPARAPVELEMDGLDLTATLDGVGYRIEPDGSLVDGAGGHGGAA